MCVRNASARVRTAEAATHKLEMMELFSITNHTNSSRYCCRYRRCVIKGQPGSTNQEMLDVYFINKRNLSQDSLTTEWAQPP